MGPQRKNKKKGENKEKRENKRTKRKPGIIEEDIITHSIIHISLYIHP